MTRSSRFIKAGGYMLKVPAIDIAEVGAGGGSLASIDHGGVLAVGAHTPRAGPGPAPAAPAPSRAALFPPPPPPRPQPTPGTPPGPTARPKPTAEPRGGGRPPA